MTKDAASFSCLNVAEIEISYKNAVKPSQRAKITCSTDCYDILVQHWNKNTLDLFEDFYVLLLNNAHRVLGLAKIATGGATRCEVDPKKVFSVALLSGACKIVLAHNHPSGNLEPSDVDIRLTKNIEESGKLMEIKVIDHIIVTSDGYFSFADNGLL
jgi:DNA repair protein RadC